ncbi:MAG TPA: FIST N-terminal domain-containing protein, partial [Longimicrobium sp.]
MTQAAVAQTRETGHAAGQALCSSIREQLGGLQPHALIVFASPDQDHAALLAALQEGCAPGALVGCSSAGEFTSSEAGTG